MFLASSYLHPKDYCKILLNFATCYSLLLLLVKVIFRLQWLFLFVGLSSTYELKYERHEKKNKPLNH